MPFALHETGCKNAEALLVLRKRTIPVKFLFSPLNPTSCLIAISLILFFPTPLLAHPFAWCSEFCLITAKLLSLQVLTLPFHSFYVLLKITGPTHNLSPLHPSANWISSFLKPCQDSALWVAMGRKLHIFYLQCASCDTPVVEAYCGTICKEMRIFF